MQSKKREKEEGKSPKKSKAQKNSKETDTENIDSTNVPLLSTVVSFMIL